MIEAIQREEFQGIFHGINYQAHGTILMRYKKKLVIRIGGSSYYSQVNGRKYDPAYTVLFDTEEDGLRCSTEIRGGGRVSEKMFRSLLPRIARFMGLTEGRIEEALEAGMHNKWMKTIVITG